MIRILLASFIFNYVFATDWYYPQILESGLKIGQSLYGKSLKQLQPGKNPVELSGGVENFSRYKLHLRKVEIVTGTSIRTMPSVAAGTIEAFINVKNNLVPTGIWTRYTLDIDDDIYVHFMISAPYTFNQHDNCLAISLCGKTDQSCISLTAEKMYYNKYPFLVRKHFKTPAEWPIKMCYDNLCMSGYMESHHRPVVVFRLYPKSYHNLSNNIKAKAVSLTRYEEYVKTIFK